MKQQRDTLKRYQQRVEKLLEKERELAKKLLSENKKEYVWNKIIILIKYNIQTYKSYKLSIVKYL